MTESVLLGLKKSKDAENHTCCGFGHLQCLYGRKCAHYGHHHHQLFIRLTYVLVPDPSLFCWCLLLLCNYSQTDHIFTLWKQNKPFQWMHDSDLWGTCICRCWCHPVHRDGLWQLCGHLQALALYDDHESVTVWTASGSNMDGSLYSLNHRATLYHEITLLWP